MALAGVVGTVRCPAVHVYMHERVPSRCRSPDPVRSGQEGMGAWEHGSMGGSPILLPVTSLSVITL
jgi:hypothetical protein